MVSPLDFGEIISKSKTRISISQLMKNEGYSNQDEFISWLMSDSVVPALCVDGCRVEPDGKCPHGNPSSLKVLLMIDTRLHWQCLKCGTFHYIEQKVHDRCAFCGFLRTAGF